MDKYKSYLATKVLNEGQVVTYQSLSRALKVHVTLAKQMLHEFHTSQKVKDPSSLQATYLISGTLKPEYEDKDSDEEGDGRGAERGEGEDHDMNEDAVMRSSPVPSSWMDNDEPSESLGFGSEAEPEDDDEDDEDSDVDLDVDEESDSAEEDMDESYVILIQEEDLDDILEEFETVDFIHVYSLQPAPLNDMHVLSATNDDVTTAYFEAIDQDPTEPLKGLGVITNPELRWRPRKKPAGVVHKAKPKEAATAAKTTTAGASKAATTTTAKPATSQPPPTYRKESSTTSTTSSTSKAKPQAKGSIMSSFAKGSTAKSKPAPAAKDDVVMQDSPALSSDDDSGSEAILSAQAVPSAQALAAKSARDTRKAQLAAMMDDSDDEAMPDAPPANQEAEDVDESAALDNKPAESAPTEMVTVSNGRRRGRRRVTKKRTFEDDEGYLVTKEEQVWESFSEDEPVAKPEVKKMKMMLSAAAGKKKGPGGQKDIASFFKKK